MELKRLLPSGQARVVLAASGGLDSTCLLHLVGTSPERPDNLHVATFDHGTGDHATEAVALVRRQAAALKLPFHSASTDRPLRTERGFRDARWAFLRSVAGWQGTVLTAHTANDHAETVAMRILRHTGPRGLAALRCSSRGVARPLLDVSRDELVRFARAHSLSWIDDPSNTSPRFLRNRVRHDLLPALERNSAGSWLHILELSRQAAEVRASLESLAGQLVEPDADEPGAVRVRLATLESLGRAERGLVWQSILGPRGVQLDHRGTRRLAALAQTARSGTTVPLSGGYVGVVQRGVVSVRLVPAGADTCAELSPEHPVRLGDWLFRVTEQVEPPSGSAGYSGDALVVGRDVVLKVRPWRGGDRIRIGDGRQRRVKRFLYEAGVPAPLRRGWPVVEADGEIICVPGVCRAHATPERSGRPLRRVVCERVSG
jgi:tRNA(Ile)-lysidine synthase